MVTVTMITSIEVTVAVTAMVTVMITVEMKLPTSER